jgi:hypothetical protein
MLAGTRTSCAFQLRIGAGSNAHTTLAPCYLARTHLEPVRALEPRARLRVAACLRFPIQPCDQHRSSLAAMVTVFTYALRAVQQRQVITS